MKRKILICWIVLCNTILLSAQDITTMWPYQYADFRKGTVYFKDQKTLSGELNVHLLRSTLHYLNNGKIMEAKTDDIAFVLIDNMIQDASVPDKYYVCDRQLMRVIGGDSTNFIAELILADFDANNESGGAYGSSSGVQSTRKLTSLDSNIGGIGLTNHIELKNKKDEGMLLQVTQKYFIVIADAIYPATRRGIESKLPDDQKETFKQFVKQHKINWKKPESLAKLLEFFLD